MANKITESISLTITGPSFSAKMAGAVTSEQEGSHYTEQTQVIPSGTESEILDIAVDIPDGGLGYLIVRNMELKVDGVALDAQNAVDIATDEAIQNVIATIQPEKGVFLPPPNGTTQLWARAKNADAQIIFLAIQK